jgi:hypothetical protein
VRGSEFLIFLLAPEENNGNGQTGIHEVCLRQVMPPITKLHCFDFHRASRPTHRPAVIFFEVITNFTSALWHFLNDA